MREFYHYTSRYHLPVILYDGYLKLTESNLRLEEEMYKPVVWLTSAEVLSAYALGLNGGIANKTEIKITLRESNNYKNWTIWSHDNRIKKSWANRLASGRNPNNWYICEQPIQLTKETVLKIENVITGEVLLDTENDKLICECEVLELPTTSGISIKTALLGDRPLQVGDKINFTLS